MMFQLQRLNSVKHGKVIMNCMQELWMKQAWPISRYYSGIQLMRLRKTIKTLKFASNTAKNQTKYLPNTSLEHYCIVYIGQPMHLRWFITEVI